MTGREKIEAAFSSQGSPQTPAVVCYEEIFFRDHWSQITSRPWWCLHSPDIADQLAWQEEYISRVGLDWCRVTAFHSRREREDLFVQSRPGGAWLVNRRTGEEKQLAEPLVGGETSKIPDNLQHPSPPKSRQEIDGVVALAPVFDGEKFLAEGRHDLAERKLATCGAGRWALAHVPSPFTRLYFTWGFEGMMTLIGERPELARYACERFLQARVQQARQAAAFGARGVWIEETFTDQIGPRAYEAVAEPALRELLAEFRRLGMKTIYYFCGNPWPVFDRLLAVGADALAFEESKKDFAIDIEEVARRVGGRCTILGNLDALGVLELGGEDELRREIGRQIAAGRRNGNRFIMSTGSPPTPGTSVQRLRRYVDLVHELGS